MRANTGLEANALIISRDTLSDLLQNTAIIARFPGAVAVTEAMIRDNMAALFGLQRLIVGGGAYDALGEGRAFAGATSIWGTTYAMVAVVSAGSPRLVPSLGRTFVRTPMTGVDLSVVSYREEQTASEIFRVEEYSQEKIVDACFGHLLEIN